MIAFFETLKNNAKLTDAQAEMMRGYAQMLRQSGYKVDVKIDSDLEGTTIQQNNFWRNTVIY